jgi:hypothetical protein
MPQMDFYIYLLPPINQLVLEHKGSAIISIPKGIAFLSKCSNIEDSPFLINSFCNEYNSLELYSFISCGIISYSLFDILSR